MTKMETDKQMDLDTTLLNFLGVQFLQDDETEKDQNNNVNTTGDEKDNDDPVDIDNEHHSDINERGDQTPNLYETSQEKPSQNDTNTCQICKMTFKRKTNLKRHLKKHAGKMETCMYCPKEFYTKYDVKQHVNSVHKNITLNCKICNKKFKSKMGLENHCREHDSNWKYLCPYCGKGFNYKADFEGHKFGHEGIKPFNCTKCNKKFQYESNQKRHSQLCGKKISGHKCDICGKKFKLMKYVKEHLKGHSNPERYQCCTCGNLYKHRAGLFKHRKVTGHK